MLTRPRPTGSRARAQNLVEYGLLVAVVMLVFVAGLNLMLNAQAGFLAGSVTKPDPTVIAGLPLHAVTMDGACPVPPSPALVYTGDSFQCSLTLTDRFTGGPTQPPMGSISFARATGSFVGCNLQAVSSNSSFCSFTYMPTTTRDQTLTADYVPDSNHLPQTWTQAGSVYARDRTHIDPSSSCASSAPLAEPVLCTASVVDEFTGGLLPVTLDTTSAAAAGWTFSDAGQLAAQGAPYVCQNQPNGMCYFLFRSDAVRRATGRYAITPSFARDADHEASPAFPSMPVTVSGSSVHKASLSMSCRPGMTYTSPLRVSSRQTTRCTAIVTDTNDPVIDQYGYADPTNVLPTGDVTWSAQPSANGDGNLSTSTCLLRRVTLTTAQCAAVYTPTVVGDADASGISVHAIDASFSGQAQVYTPAGAPLQVTGVQVYVTN